MTDSIERLYDYLRDSGQVPGAVVHIEREGRPLVHRTFGRLRGDGDAPMREDAIFRIASLTKPLVSTLALMLVEARELDLDAAVAAYLPALAELKAPGGGRAARAPTVRDLMRHTAGFAYEPEYRDAEGRAAMAAAAIDANLPRLRAGEFLTTLAGVPLACEPGTAFRYGFSTDVLGLAIERVTGRRLGEALRARVLEPLGMHDTGFAIPAGLSDRVATALPSDALWHAFAARYPGEGEQGDALQSGGGGLVSTVADYLRFARMLVNGGELDGTRLLRPDTLAVMCRDALGPGIDGPANLTGPGFGFGLGLAVRHDWGGSAYPTVAGEVTWSGICGPVLYAHPRERWIALSFSCNMRTRMLARMNFRHAAQAVLAAG